MSFFNFFNKKKDQDAKWEQLEKLLTHTNKWKYRGIRRSFLDVDFGEAFLETIVLDKQKTFTLRDLKVWGNRLQRDGKVYCKPEIEELSKQMGFNAWEAFEWEKEQHETIEHIKSLSMPV